MGRTKTLALGVLGLLFALPSSAFAVNDAIVVPGWLSYGAGVLGLATAAMLMLDAVLLRRVSEGSMIADNIVYMMLGVVCIATSVLVRWAGAIAAMAELRDFITFAADLVHTAGMGLLAVYFIRVRTAMTRYLQSAKAYKESAATGEGSVSG
ncbi:hypothetical protein EG835_09985 [bacterium]|nr:hypothetical protein [bacterium]